MANLLVVKALRLVPALSCFETHRDGECVMHAMQKENEENSLEGKREQFGRKKGPLITTSCDGHCEQ